MIWFFPLILVLLFFFLFFGLNTWIGCRYFGVCPRCNSDAPDIDTCRVCEGYRWTDTDPITKTYRGKPSIELREIWLEKDRSLP